MEAHLRTRYIGRHTVNEPQLPLTRPGDGAHDPPRASHARQSQLVVIGIVLLALWAWWWIQTLRHDQLALAHLTRIPAWRFLGLDFLHNYHAARLWMSGGNPYT